MGYESGLRACGWTVNGADKCITRRPDMVRETGKNTSNHASALKSTFAFLAYYMTHHDLRNSSPQSNTVSVPKFVKFSYTVKSSRLNEMITVTPPTLSTQTETDVRYFLSHKVGIFFVVRHVENGVRQSKRSVAHCCSCHMAHLGLCDQKNKGVHVDFWPPSLRSGTGAF